MGLLNYKTALVTGGTSGIGLATAQRLAAEGAHVFVTGRNQVTLAEAVEAIGDQATGVQADVSRPEDLDTVVEAIRVHGRGLDVVFANAGGGEFAALPDITPEHLADTFETNVYGTVYTVQKTLPLLNAGASVVLAGSTAAHNGTPSFSAYAASKAAIRSLGRHGPPSSPTAGSASTPSRPARSRPADSRSLLPRAGNRSCSTSSPPRCHCGVSAGRTKSPLPSCTSLPS